MKTSSAGELMMEERVSTNYIYSNRRQREKGVGLGNYFDARK